MAVCAPDVLCQPVLVDDLVAALAHGLPEVGAVVLEAVALQHLQAAELALAHQATEVRDGRLRGKCTYDVHRFKRGRHWGHTGRPWWWRTWVGLT